MQIVRVPSWGFDYCEARHYGRRHSVHVGPFLIFWGQMTEAELRTYGNSLRKPMVWPTEAEIRAAFPTHPEFGEVVRMVPATREKADGHE
jgi:hypothetical protein